MRGPFDRGGDGRPFKPGQSGNPDGYSKGRRGRPPGVKPHPVVLWDLQQAARGLRPSSVLRDLLEREFPETSGQFRLPL